MWQQSMRIAILHKHICFSSHGIACNHTSESDKSMNRWLTRKIRHRVTDHDSFIFVPNKAIDHDPFTTGVRKGAGDIHANVIPLLIMK